MQDQNKGKPATLKQVYDAFTRISMPDWDKLYAKGKDSVGEAVDGLLSGRWSWYPALHPDIRQTILIYAKLWRCRHTQGASRELFVEDIEKLAEELGLLTDETVQDAEQLETEEYGFEGFTESLWNRMLAIVAKDREVKTFLEYRRAKPLSVGTRSRKRRIMLHLLSAAEDLEWTEAKIRNVVKRARRLLRPLYQEIRSSVGLDAQRSPA